MKEVFSGIDVFRVKMILMFLKRHILIKGTIISTLISLQYMQYIMLGVNRGFDLGFGNFIIERKKLVRGLAGSGDLIG